MSLPDAIYPTPNLNGTSRRELMEQYIDALNAVQAAHDKIRAIAPHGRDYPDSCNLRLAAAHNKAMLVYLEEILHRIENLGLHLQETAGGL
jgi:hypothetical protein